MKTTAPHPASPSIEVCGLEHRWELDRGSFTIGGVPCVAFFRDSSLARIFVGFLTTLGPQRFSLMMLAEGQRSIDDDWAIIRAAPSFERGFAELSRYAFVAGWGRWELVALDRAAPTMTVRVHNSWEGEVQRVMGLGYGVGLVAGKLAGYGQRLFGARCWPRQTRFIADGDAFDEIVVEPSTRSIDDELGALAEAGQATNMDLHRLLADLKASASRASRSSTSPASRRSTPPPPTTSSGAQGVISGIGPMVAQTIVDLGVDLSGVRTFSNLREALRACIAAPARSRRHG